MISTYLKVAWRVILRNRYISLVNVIGLSVAFVCVIMISLWLDKTLTYNRSFEDSSSIYRVNKRYLMNDAEQYNASTPYPLAEAAAKSIPGIRTATKIYNGHAWVKFEEGNLQEERVGYTDPSFFKTFEHIWVWGDIEEVFSEPNSVILSEAQYRKFFGNKPFGPQQIVIDEVSMTVSGVYRIVPNSSFRSEIYVNIAELLDEQGRENWGSQWFHTYVRIDKSASPSGIESELTELIRQHLETEQIWLHMQAFTALHLYEPDGKPSGIVSVWVFTVAGLLILVIACINFINLIMSQNIIRKTEIGMRKVMGAGRKEIFGQLFAESILLAFVSLILAFLAVDLLTPKLNVLLGTEISIDFTDWRIWLLSAVLLVLSGLVPAASFSRLSVLTIFQRSSSLRIGKFYFRKALIVVQFALTAILFISVFTIFGQLRFMQTKDLGYNKDNLLWLSYDGGIQGNWDAYRQKCGQIPGIAGIARSSGLPGEMWNIMRGIRWADPNSDAGNAYAVNAIDESFLPVMGIELVKGSNITAESAERNEVLINQMAYNLIGDEDIIGKPLKNPESTIVGVVENFHFLPLKNEMEPMILDVTPGFYSYVLLRVGEGMIHQTIAGLEELHKEFNPDRTFEYGFVDDRFEILYRDEIRMRNLFGWFSVAGILISSFGLYGLVSILVEQRRKEISIRKVLGATPASILKTFLGSYAALLAISLVIAMVAGFFAMDRWLRLFHYRSGLQPEAFILSALFVLIPALVAIGIKILSISRLQTAETLRAE